MKLYKKVTVKDAFVKGAQNIEWISTSKTNKAKTFSTVVMVCIVDPLSNNYKRTTFVAYNGWQAVCAPEITSITLEWSLDTIRCPVLYKRWDLKV
jgi:hypothetical protein